MALIYLVGVIVGLATVVAFSNMDSMLADVIDYDTMHTGKRAEGVYTVAETNLQQFIEIIGGVAPLLALSAVGFENNGGCTCGCGVACDSPYMRWMCPGDIAYSCTSSFDAPPLHGLDPAFSNRTAPCVEQTSDGVNWVVSTFLFLLSALWTIIAAIAAKGYPISQDKHKAIIEATDALNAGKTANDPITGEPIVRKSDSPAALQLEHFTTSELKQRSGLVQRITLRLFLLIAFFVGLVIAMAASTGHAIQEYIVTIGALFCSAIFVLVPWNIVRLRVAMTLGAVAQIADSSPVSAVH